MASTGMRSTPAPTESRGLIALLGFAVSIRTVCASRGKAQKSRLSAQGVFQDKNRRAIGMSCPGIMIRESFEGVDLLSELYLTPNCSRQCFVLSTSDSRYARRKSSMGQPA